MPDFNVGITPRTGYEAVFTVSDYHDGPRGGVANFQGTPHFYECVFDAKSDDYLDSYLLTPISQGAFNAALENWEIFLRWRKAFDSGQVALDTHPALFQDKNRYEETKRTLDHAVISGQGKAIRMTGKFEVLGQQNATRDMLTPWQVKWSEE
jgi:hypothetical protein